MAHEQQDEQKQVVKRLREIAETAEDDPVKAAEDAVAVLRDFASRLREVPDGVG